MQAETQDGGDAKVEVSPRDIVYTAPAEDDGTPPSVLATTDQRYGGISWQTDERAMLYESWYKTRNTKTWVGGALGALLTSVLARWEVLSEL